MRLIILCFCLLTTFHSQACTEVMAPYELECKIQDRWNKLSKDYSVQKVEMKNVKGFAIPRVLGKNYYYKSKNEFLNSSEISLQHNIDWQIWNKGNKFFADYRPVFVEMNDVLKLHKTMFVEKLDAGKLRVLFGQTNPKEEIKCSDQLLNKETASLIESYDLKSVEGYPLVSLENFNQCEDKKSYSGEIVFYKGASMKTELKAWLVDYNEMINDFEAGRSHSGISPILYLADMKRWFLAIHPFVYGNDSVATALLDFASKKLELPPLALAKNNHLIDIKVNRDSTLKTTQEFLQFLENCLFDVKIGLVAPECSSL